MTDWTLLPKIDAHIHILPEEVHLANPNMDDEFVFARLSCYAPLMAQYHIERAVIMPFNDPFLMSMGFTAADVHRNLLFMTADTRFLAFADVDVRSAPEASCHELERAAQLGLCGLKLHPANSGMPADAAYNYQLVETAKRLQLPVAIHCYPNGEDDPCAARRVRSLILSHPTAKFIVSHMGAMQWETLLDTSAYVDLSAILPVYYRAYGRAKTNDILRAFGAKRLIFATDYPTSRLLPPEQIYNSYFEILNQMDFSSDEAEQIARENIKLLLKQA